MKKIPEDKPFGSYEEYIKYALKGETVDYLNNFIKSTEDKLIVMGIIQQPAGKQGGNNNPEGLGGRGNKKQYLNNSAKNNDCQDASGKLTESKSYGSNKQSYIIAKIKKLASGGYDGKKLLGKPVTPEQVEQAKEVLEKLEKGLYKSAATAGRECGAIKQPLTNYEKAVKALKNLNKKELKKIHKEHPDLFDFL